ncbi:MAG TPA: N-methyl-L-tryptophan oxidase [Candidatus Limnocylindrales bacterium]|nr:N-methyl-L-tryptophan oxidase [Candidatus Limnocylindrales bacterium]
MHRRDWDAIVVGLGGIGSGAAYWLSRSLGAGVLGLEQFGLDHDRGASSDHSRIIRLSYHRPDYVRLARRAYEAWDAVEREAGERIVTITGGLDLWPANAAIPRSDYTDSLTAETVPFELLDAPEIRHRWPQWRVDDSVSGLWQARGGIADPLRGNAAHRRLAKANGATLRANATVRALRDAGGGEVDVVTDTQTYRTSRVVLAADAWTNQLLAPLGRRLPLEVTREQVTYFACPDPAAFAPDRFPVWIWMDDPSFYGFPTYGEAGPKVAQDCGGQPVDPDRRSFERDEAAFERVTGFVDRHLPRAAGPPIYTKTCLYTLTPERDFVVDRLPELRSVMVVLGAGHGYKFASVLGRIAAELTMDGTTPSATEIEAFRIDRALLRQPDPPTSWMV